MEYKNIGENKIPVLGLGTYRITDKEVCKKSVLTALSLGYRHIDTAEIYGNQDAIGEALKEANVDRKELFITTKIWVTNYERVREAFKRDLEVLGLEYVDLLLLHQPVGEYMIAFKELIKLKDEGLVKAIGVSNFTNEMIDEIVKETGVTPEDNQIELHPFYQRKADKEYLDSKGILIEDWYPLANAKAVLLENATIVKIAEKHNKTPGQVILRWHLQLGHIIFPRSTSEKHLKENIEIFDFVLDEEDMKKIEALDEGRSYDFPLMLKKIFCKIIKPTV